MAAKPINIENILNQVKQLNYSERVTILEIVILFIKEKSKIKQPVKLSSISGLGSEIWQNVDTHKYIENERKWD